MSFKYLIVILLTLLLVQLACADVEVSDLEDLTFEVNYEALEDNEDSVEISHSVIFTNSGAVEENVTLTLSAEDSDYTIEFNDAADENFVLTAGESIAVTFDIVQEISSGDAGIEEDVLSILLGTLNGQSETFDLDADIEYMLIMNEIELYIDGISEETIDENDVDDDDVDLEIAPGDLIRLEFELENLYDNNYNDGDMDIVLTVTIDDNDFGDDIDEEFEFDIDADDKSTDKYIEFEVPADAEDGEYEMEVLVEAEDENSIDYTIEWSIYLDVEREDDDVRITDVSVSSTSVSCSDTITITVDIENYGSDTQRYGVLEITEDDLGISLEEDFTLESATDSGSTDSLQFTVTLDDEAASGTYQIDVRAYYDYDDLSDIYLYDLDLSECEVEEVVEEEEEEETPSESATEITVTDNESEESSDDTSEGVLVESDSETVSTVENSYLKDEYFLALIIVAGMLFLALLFVLIMLLARK